VRKKRKTCDIHSPRDTHDLIAPRCLARHVSADRYVPYGGRVQLNVRWNPQRKPTPSFDETVKMFLFNESIVYYCFMIIWKYSYFGCFEIVVKCDLGNFCSHLFFIDLMFSANRKKCVKRLWIIANYYNMFFNKIKINVYTYLVYTMYIKWISYIIVQFINLISVFLANKIVNFYYTNSLKEPYG
jgi:hypothetical protein